MINDDDSVTLGGGRYGYSVAVCALTVLLPRMLAGKPALSPLPRLSPRD